MTNSLDYFHGNELAATVAEGKYLLVDTQGNRVEKNPSDIHKRLAKDFARIEANYKSYNPSATALTEEKIFNYLDRFKYIIAQGSPMSAIGNPYQIQSTSNCFVISAPADSYGGILYTDQEMVQIMKRRGGVGFDLSTLRPRGLHTNNAARTTDGITLFAERFSNSCREVAQGGRRGALMLTLSCHHPQVEDFINMKRDLAKVTGANVSVKLTDNFMYAVLNDLDYAQQWPVDSSDPQIVNVVPARQVWDQIVNAAWETGDPGVLFWDTVTDHTPSDLYSSLGFGSVSTNPCSEITMNPYDSCRLMVINICSFVSNPFTDRAEFHWDELERVAGIAQRLSDDMIDLELEAIDRIIAKIQADPEDDSIKKIELDLWDKIKLTARLGRRTGLGPTAIGDAMAMMDTKYGSKDSLTFVNEVYRRIAVGAYKESCRLAKERGTFLIFDHKLEETSTYLHTILGQDYELRELYHKYGRRNIACTTTAPCGSVSLLALLSDKHNLFSTTSGIEPLFRVQEHTRRKKVNPSDDVAEELISTDEHGDKWTEYKIYHSGIELWKQVTGETDVTKSPYYGACSDDLDPEYRVALQAKAQQWVDHAISSTVNLPNNATKQDIDDIYRAAYLSGCKGITVFRDGCRPGILITKKPEAVKSSDYNHADKRPEELGCDIHTTIVDGERFFVLIGLNSDKGDRPYEIFAGPVRSLPELSLSATVGSIAKHKYKTVPSKYDLHIGEQVVRDIIHRLDSPEYASFSRTISLLLRHKVPIKYIVAQLKKDKQNTLYSFAKAVARILAKYIKDGDDAGQRCIECGNKTVIFQEGCSRCTSCGWAGCG